MNVRFTRVAIRQIEMALAYLSERSVSGASELAERLQEIATLLGEYPAAGLMTSRTGVRRLTLAPYPYLLFYRVVGDEIVVIRVRHAARKDAPNAPRT